MSQRASVTVPTRGTTLDWVINCVKHMMNNNVQRTPWKPEATIAVTEVLYNIHVAEVQLPPLQSVNQSGCRLAGRQISILDFALISGPTSGWLHHVDVIIVVVAIIVTKLHYSKALSSVRNIFPFPC